MKTGLVKRFEELKDLKKAKTNLMNKIATYIEPSDESMAVRTFGTKVLPQQSVSSEENMIFDVTSRNLLEEYALDSLSDIINPYETWFTFDIRKKLEVEQEVIQEWSNTATEEFYTFINQSPYYSNLITDRYFYVIYGFSGLSFYSKSSELQVVQEDPFNLYISKDAREIMWVNTYSAVEMEEMFEYKPQDIKTSKSYKVLCATVPNHPVYFEGLTNSEEKEEERKIKYKKGFKYIQTYVLLGSVFEKDDLANQASENYSKIDGGYLEIGRRVYLREPFTVVPVDWRNRSGIYGEGWGKKLLVQTYNLNQLKRDMYRSSAFIGDPPIQAPVDVLGSNFTRLYPGLVAPTSYTGQKLEVIAPPTELQAQLTLMEYEIGQIRSSIPSPNPPQKASRQSQFEVDKNYMTSNRKNLIYKLTYLKDGVSKHLRLMFKIALELGAITPLPQGVKESDVAPSLASIILREYKKQKSQSYLQAYSASQPFISGSPRSLDIINSDKAVKNNFTNFGGDDLINPSDKVQQIRQERQRQEQQQLQMEQARVNAELQVMGAKALRDSGAGAKDMNQLQQTEE